VPSMLALLQNLPRLQDARQERPQTGFSTSAKPPDLSIANIPTSLVEPYLFFTGSNYAVMQWLPSPSK